MSCVNSKKHWFAGNLLPLSNLAMISLRQQVICYFSSFLLLNFVISGKIYANNTFQVWLSDKLDAKLLHLTYSIILMI